MDFNKIEQDVINWWDEIHLKETIMENNKDKPLFNFVDGPPFLTGTMHHGHMLVSYIKDIIARYMMQKGYNITYQTGFDTHGLPIETIAEDRVGKCSPSDSPEAIAKFNNMCRHIISTCSTDWFEKYNRIGRVFDMSETYYTCSMDYMKCLWWGFSELYRKGLIYKSKKVMPYSYALMTPLSNFEASDNYKEKTDIAVYVKVNIDSSPEFNMKGITSSQSLLVYTTTPWSLFANQGICVNPELEYVLICDKEYSNKMWMEESCYMKLFTPDMGYTIIKQVKGSELVGLSYYPILPVSGNKDYIEISNKLKLKVYGDSYVEKGSGTGIVHLAPMFGADDMRVMKNNNYNDTMLPTYLIDNQCRFKINYNVNGKNIREINVIDSTLDIVIDLKKIGIVYKSEKIKHMYPYCYRTDTPLVYLATDAWFLNVSKINADLVANNNMIVWSPAHVGERFANWIKDSPDWCLSRNRVWGTPIPIWTNEHNDMICISNINMLSKYTGKKYDDMHLDSLGNTDFVYNNTTYKRTFGVLDCWFESGMAPLARHGYPTCTDASLHEPVDFIAESLDQTRGWFYTLNVLSTALYNKPAFKKVIVSGLILAADGKKMSKRLSNYTSPDNLISIYGADILRLYLLGCPASKAESFCFNDNDLNEIKRKIIPYYNAIMLYNDTKTLTDITHVTTYNNKLDRWILNKFMELSKKVYNMIESLQLTAIPNMFFRFIDNLCNVYIKLSRDRLKNMESYEDYNESNNMLYNILHQFNILLVPFMPHMSEYFNKMLHNNLETFVSVHTYSIDFDMIEKFEVDYDLLNGFCSIEEILETVRNLRLMIKKPLIYPLNYIILYTDDSNIIEYKDVIMKQLNINEMIVKPTSMLSRTYKPNKMELGRIFKKEAKKYEDMILAGDITFPECKDTFYTMELNVDMKADFVGMKFSYMDNQNIRKNAVVYLNSTTDSDNDMMANINTIRRHINNIRKERGLKMYNKIEVDFEMNSFWEFVDTQYIDTLKNQLGSNIHFSNVDNYNYSMETFNSNTVKFNIIDIME